MTARGKRLLRAYTFIHSLVSRRISIQQAIDKSAERALRVPTIRIVEVEAGTR